MIEVAFVFVNATFAVLANFRVKEFAVGVVALREESADRDVWCVVNQFEVGNGND